MIRICRRPRAGLLDSPYLYSRVVLSIPSVLEICPCAGASKIRTRITRGHRTLHDLAIDVVRLLSILLRLYGPACVNSLNRTARVMYLLLFKDNVVVVTTAHSHSERRRYEDRRCNFSWGVLRYSFSFLFSFSYGDELRCHGLALGVERV